MSTRPASPPPVARWKIVLGMTVFLAVGATVLFLGASPPGPLTLIVLLVCLAASVALFLTPSILEYEARLRVAEAHVRDHIESQIRRLTQTTEQLGNAISRSQSTEEQVGQTLGTLEELTEKLNAQVEELGQNLARSQEREVTSLKTEMQRLVQERDERLAILEQRLDTANGLVSELQLTVRKTASGTAKALEEIKERLNSLTLRLEPRTATASAPPLPAPPLPAPPETVAQSSSEPASATASATTPNSPESAPAAVPAPADREERKPRAADTSLQALDNASSPVAPRPRPAAAGVRHGAVMDTPAHDSETPVTTAVKPRPRRSADTPTHPPSRISPKPQPLDLPLLDLDEPQPVVHRDASSGTSTLVATAYIGIGNKLYVRGDGPGLNWDQGVPMQFLAIGKWGWTSPEAGEPITCRIYRNDETPMLDENIIIAPGAKAEVTPRF